MNSFQKQSTRLRFLQMTTKELFWMMEFQHWPWAIKFAKSKRDGDFAGSGKCVINFEGKFR